MQEIKITIKHAQLISFRVSLGSEKPSVEVYVALIDSFGKQVSTLSLSSSSWNEEAKMEVPEYIHSDIARLMSQLENCVALHFNKGAKALTSGKKKS